MRTRPGFGIGPRRRIAAAEGEESIADREQQDRRRSALATPLLRPVRPVCLGRTSVVLSEGMGIDRDIGHACVALRHGERPTQERGRPGVRRRKQPDEQDQSHETCRAHAERACCEIHPSLEGHEISPRGPGPQAGPVLQHVIAKQCMRTLGGGEPLAGTSWLPGIEDDVRPGRANQAVSAPELDDPGIHRSGLEGVHRSPPHGRCDVSRNREHSTCSMWESQQPGRLDRVLDELVPRGP